jgi:hypothetical protein
MTTTCLEPPILAADVALDMELAAASRCAAILAAAGLEMAFDHTAAGEVRIAAERPSGDPVRRLSSRELFALIALSPEELQAWAERPELPIPGRAEQAAAR